MPLAEGQRYYRQSPERPMRIFMVHDDHSAWFSRDSFDIEVGREADNENAPLWQPGVRLGVLVNDGTSEMVRPFIDILWPDDSRERLILLPEETITFADEEPRPTWQERLGKGD